MPHTVSSLSILRDRGDRGDSQKGIQTMPPSTSATLMVVMTTHLSDGLVRDVHGERHGVATALGAVIRQPPTASDKVLNLFTYSTYVREWYGACTVECVSLLEESIVHLCIPRLTCTFKKYRVHVPYLYLISLIAHAMRASSVQSSTTAPGVSSLLPPSLARILYVRPTGATC